MTKSEKEFLKFMKGKDHALLLRDLIHLYSNDKNSSFLREMVTCSVVGYQHNPEKLGYDGSSKNYPVEVKPQNIKSTDKVKLNASGSFTDFTWRKYNKCCKDRVRILMSGFINGKLMFIIEFPFNNLFFKKHLLKKLKKFLPNGDKKNRYIRSCKWSLIHFNQATILYRFKNFGKFKQYFSKKLFDFLENGIVKNA